MKTTRGDLSTSILAFSQRYVEEYQLTFNHLPLVESDENWPSPCLNGNFDKQLNYWKPVELPQPLSFDNVEEALELTIHPSISEYYNVIYSESIPSHCDEGYLQLLFAWSDDDFSRLQQNIIGHILMKQKLKQAITIFFAVTDDDNIVLSVNNDSGEVWAERVGCEPHKKIANTLTEFINSLTPDIYTQDS